MALELRKISETANLIVLGWTPPAGVEWYVFFADGQRVSNAPPVDKNGVVKDAIQFHKTSPGPPFEVAAICRVDGELVLEVGRYEDAPPPPPPPPAFQISHSFSSGATISGSVAWSAVPSDVPGTERVEFFVDGVLEWTERNPPYDFNGTPGGRLDTSELDNGSHRLSARAYHRDGRTATVETGVTVNNAAPTPPPPPPPPPGTRRWAVNASDWYDAAHNPNLIKNLGAKIVREARSIPSNPAALDSDFARYSSQGMKLLWEAAFNTPPSTSVASQIGPVAHRHKDKLVGVEYGNENAYSHITPGDVRPAARNYALGAKAAYQAMQGSGVPLVLQIGSDALRGSAWADAMFEAVPDLENYCDGWVIHPYGPPRNYPGAANSWGEDRITRSIADANKHGAGHLPVWFTEWGLAWAVDGRTLDDNYGWPRNMNAAAAIAALKATEAMWDRLLGDKLVFVSHYHDFDTHGTGNGRESFFGIVQANGQPKGAYTDEIKRRLRDTVV